MSAREPITRSRATRCLLLNLFLLPGAGSLVGGRRSGWWQLMLLAVGLVCIAPLAAEIVTQLLKVYQSIEGFADSQADVPQYGDVKEQMMTVLRQRGGLAFTGLVVILASYVWALFTGISLMTEAGRAEPPLAEPEAKEEDPFA